jgi:hypothetical protein
MRLIGVFRAFYGPEAGAVLIWARCGYLLPDWAVEIHSAEDAWAVVEQVMPSWTPIHLKPQLRIDAVQKIRRRVTQATTVAAGHVRALSSAQR